MSITRHSRSRVAFAAAAAMLLAGAAQAGEGRLQRNMQTAPQGPNNLTSNGAARPDLIVVPALPAGAAKGLPGTGFCNKPHGGPATAIVFKVKNQGNAPAGASVVVVTFLGAGGQAMNVPVLPAGSSASLQLAIPAGAYPPAGSHGSANFTIAADTSKQVAEASETNNSASSYCLAPAV